MFFFVIAATVHHLQLHTFWFNFDSPKCFPDSWFDPSPSLPPLVQPSLSHSILKEKFDPRCFAHCCLLSLVHSHWFYASGIELPQSSAPMARLSLNRRNPCLVQQTVTNGSQNDAGTHLQSSMWPWTDGAEGEDVGEKKRKQGRTKEEGRGNGSVLGWQEKEIGPREKACA